MVDIVEINKKLSNGCTVPYVIWCSDGNKYVAKFPGNPNGDKALINEFISSRLCDFLDLPIMKYQLISVKMEDYMSSDITPMIGTAFGTIYDDDLLTVLNSGEIQKAKNCYDAIKILIFDLLIGNYDRNKGNLMINPKTKRIIMIDHTHIFNMGVVWDEYQLPRLEKEEFSISNLNAFNYNNLFNSIKYNEQFYKELNDFVKKVKTIEEERVSNIINDIPKDWIITNEERKCIINFIVNRFKRVDEVLKVLGLKGGDNSEI